MLVLGVVRVPDRWPWPTLQNAYAWSDYLTLQDAFKSADDAACLKYSYSGSTHKVAGSFDEL